MRWPVAFLITGLALTPLTALADGVANAPPPMPREYMPPKPTDQGVVVWVPGFWKWNGENYIWLRGAYVSPPVAGQNWTPGHWVRQHGEWYWIAGFWH